MRKWTVEFKSGHFDVKLCFNMCFNASQNQSPRHSVLKSLFARLLCGEAHMRATCVVCEKDKTDSESWKLCKGCPAVAHPNCMPSFDGFCPSCEREQCGVCGRGRLLADDHVGCGNARDGCERVFHLSCVGLDRVPEDDWFCESCRDAADSEKRRNVSRRKSLEERSTNAVRVALENFEKTKTPEAWLKARDAKMALFKARAAMPRVLPRLRRVRLLSFSYLRRRKPTAHETQDVRHCVRHPASKDATLLAIATPSLRYLKSWGPSTSSRTTTLLSAADRFLKRGAEFQRCVTSHLRDGTDPAVQQALVKHDPDGILNLVRRAQFLAHTWSEGSVLTLAYGDHLGVMRSVAVAELVKTALRNEFPDDDDEKTGLKIDLIHLDLRSIFLEHFRHSPMLTSNNNETRKHKRARVLSS